VPDLGGRLGQRRAGPDIDGPGLGEPACVHVSQPRYRVVQWATGNTGQRALREVIRHPDLELVGVLVYDEAKAGVDAGKLCDEDMTGVLASTDRDAVLNLGADCCVYMPRATGRGQTRAGLSEDELVADVVA